MQCDAIAEVDNRSSGWPCFLFQTPPGCGLRMIGVAALPPVLRHGDPLPEGADHPREHGPSPFPPWWASQIFPSHQSSAGVPGPRTKPSQSGNACGLAACLALPSACRTALDGPQVPHVYGYIRTYLACYWLAAPCFANSTSVRAPPVRSDRRSQLFYSGPQTWCEPIRALSQSKCSN